MNAYVIRTKDEREYVEPVLDDGSGPSFPYWPTGIFVASTPAQAKRDALTVWSNWQLRSGVETDDYPNLRARILFHDVDLVVSGVDRGELPFELDEDSFYGRCWGRLHEVLDHDGKSCDCPVEEAA